MVDECDLTDLVFVDITKRILRKHELNGYIAANKPAFTKMHLKTKD